MLINTALFQSMFCSGQVVQPPFIKLNGTLKIENQRTIGPENAHMKPDLEGFRHHEMTLTLNTHFY